MSVEKKIRTYIEDRGITQKWLSGRTGIPTDKLNLSLNEKRRLTFVEYQVICWALGVGVDQFMEPVAPKEKEAV